MTRSSLELCLADFSREEILGLFDRADELDGGAPRHLDPAVSDAEVTTASHRLSDESWSVLRSLHQLRQDGHSLEDLTVAWVGPATPDLHAWLEAASILSFSLRMTVPDGYEPDAGLFLACEGRAPGRLVRCRDEAGARVGAGVILTPSTPTVHVSDKSGATGLSTALADVLQARNRGRVDFRALLDAMPPRTG
ncbi:MAG: hypothetical protein SGI90_15970 [Candidatus Eisenbacteria bacterium]|nr:hypothetical protein [Candidatus Eisenbacteria bacterium]